MRLVRTEWFKLRSTRITWGLLAAVVLMTALFGILRASRAGGAGRIEIPPLNTAAGMNAIITRVEFGLLMAMVFGVILASGEFRHSTATGTYLATPHRARVLTAKFVIALCVGGLFGLAASGVATIIVLAFIAAKGYVVSLATSTIVRDIAGATLASALLAALGVGIGSLIRSQLASIITVFVWGFLVEGVLGAVFTGTQPYLPFTAATTMAGAPLGGSVSALPFWGAVGVVAAIAVAMSFLAAWVTLPRDIS